MVSSWENQYTCFTSMLPAGRAQDSSFSNKEHKAFLKRAMSFSVTWFFSARIGLMLPRRTYTASPTILFIPIVSLARLPFLVLSPFTDFVIWISLISTTSVLMVCSIVTALRMPTEILGPLYANRLPNKRL